MYILIYLFLPFFYIRFLLEYIVSLFIHLEVYGYTVGSGFPSPLLPVDVQPKYHCSPMAGWSCWDSSNFGFWIVVLTMMIIVSAHILIKKPKNKKHIFIVWYISTYLGLLLYLFFTRFIFPEPKPF